MNKAFKRKGKLSFKKAYCWYWFDSQVLNLKLSSEPFKLRSMMEIMSHF